MAGSGLSYLGWTFLPNIAASTLQSFWYRLTIRAGSPHPHPSSPQFALHHQRIRTFCVLTYLTYTLYEAYYNILLTPTFYDALSIPPTATEATIKSRFRRLAAKHHPDKNIGGGSTDGDDYFGYLKTAQDTLLDPAKRWAYGRFGPDVLRWRNVTTIKDYLYVGLQATAPYYVVGLLAIVLFSWLGFIYWGRFWRYLTLPILFTAELYLLTTSAIPSFLLTLPGRLPRTIFPLPYPLPPMLPFQLISLLRSLSITTAIAISQLSPPQTPRNGDSQQTQRTLNQLTTMAKLADAEATRLLMLSLAPFRGDAGAVRDLRRRMKEWVVLGRVRGSKGVRAVVENGRAERRRDPAETSADAEVRKRKLDLDHGRQDS